jgi:hypothetical protein
LPAALAVPGPPCLLHLPLLIPIQAKNKQLFDFLMVDAAPATAASSFASSSGGGGAALPAAPAFADSHTSTPIPTRKKQLFQQL